MSDLRYRCNKCDNITKSWTGKCFSCGAFKSLEEFVSKESISTSSRSGLKTSGAKKPVSKAAAITELVANPISRLKTGINELDRVLGGGFVEAEVLLLAGTPGAGKSTLSLDIANRYALLGHKVLYASGEESEQQIALRANRMNVTSENIRIVHESNLETLLGHIEEEQPKFVVVDSIQTFASSEVQGSVGSVTQGREVSHTLTRLAKSSGITMLLISQVVKSGDFSGSEAIQHIVDCCMMIESDRESPLKYLRCIKNRFGDTNEVGVFQHTTNGLVEVSDPSGVLLEDTLKAAGAARTFASEGIRQIPVEVQALVTHSNLTNPRKQFNGVDYQRGQIVCAILEKFCKARLYENDVFVSTVSGVKAKDPQTDLALAAAILSSLNEKPLPDGHAFIGELSLTGAVRGAFMLENKLQEAARLGFTDVVVPQVAMKQLSRKFKGIRVHGIATVSDLQRYCKTNS